MPAQRLPAPVTSFQSWKNRFEKGVLDEFDDDLPGAGFRIFQRARDDCLGGNLLARPVFKEQGDPADHHLVRLMKDASPLSLRPS